MQQRSYKMDNLRFLLIFLVVFAHFMELFPGKFTLSLYKIIYSFHMPAFLFLTGYFARYDRKKIVSNLLYPYILFQVIYLAFDTLIIQEKSIVTLQFTKPYWLLWYLLTTFCYYLILALIESNNKKNRLLILGICTVLSLLAGFDTSIGYYFSLSRTFSFLPFFVSGYYYSHVKTNPLKNRLICPASILLILTSFIFITTNSLITKKVLYGSYSYEQAEHNPLIKVLLLFIGFTWITFLISTIPDKKLPIISTLGQNTIAVFLLHGFIVKLVKKHEIFIYTEIQNLLLALLLTVIILCILGNPQSSKLFRKLFTGNWIFKQK